MYTKQQIILVEEDTISEKIFHFVFPRYIKAVTFNSFSKGMLYNWKNIIILYTFYTLNSHYNDLM